jgi:uncharacterized damage-inducible protein DinB
MSVAILPEPWLRGMWTDVPPVQRGVIHALELACEDLDRWCAPLTDAELNSRPCGVASVAFHLRHIARSLDRLLTYAEGGELNSTQTWALSAEMDEGGKHAELFGELHEALQKSARRVRALQASEFDRPRYVGAKKLPTTLGGLLVHIADHTQRHVGQAITTAKIARSHKI